uniref:Sushi domain-containing protein n=1 Tax=Chelonoidis abingdonii TaxID=106734 RepID=A0A8C0HJ36_CHEAB
VRNFFSFFFFRFRLHGRTFIQCVLKGDQVEWSQLPACQVIITQDKPTTVPPKGTEVAGTSSGLCGPLPRFSHAVPHDTDRTEGFSIGTQVTYRCHDSFVKIPGKSDTVVCLSNSKWSTVGEFCGAACGAPPRLKSAALSKEDVTKNYLPSGTTVSYVCHPGYESTELRPVITCLENLTWSEAPEFCRGKSCGVPKGPEHGRAVITNDQYGARAEIICDEGFRLHGRTFIQCLLKGDQVEWHQLPTCEAITCSPPPNIANGMHNGSNVEIFVYNSSVTYKCDHNYSLTGEASIHCTAKDNISGVWNGSAPECKGICDSLPRLSFAELPGVVNNSYPVGTELKYSCRPGYILVPGRSPVVTCLANSTWSVDPEFCVGQRGPNQRLHCVVHDTNLIERFTTNREVICSVLNTAGNSAEPEGGGPGFDTRIGISAIAIAFAISVIIIVYIRKYQKKK